jgi:2-(1,2-epoxy-1,2-dihydrophenyl)acetyl-CoA isomerase
VALGLIKQALDASETSDLDRQLERERNLQAAAAANPDHAEGVAAFLEKRPPSFRGGRY